jgi:hypothetical protein
MPAIPESHEVSEMHANRLFQAWTNAYTPGEPPPNAIFTTNQTDEKILLFRDDVLHTVRNNVDHGRGVALVLAERILARVRKLNGQRSGVVQFEWLPLDKDYVQDWEKAAQTILADVARGDYEGASEAYNYLVATSIAYLEVAQLVGAFVTASYFLKNPENSSESA